MGGEEAADGDEENTNIHFMDRVPADEGGTTSRGNNDDVDGTTEEIPCIFGACDPVQMVLPQLDGTAICASCMIGSAMTDRYWEMKKARSGAKGGKYERKGRMGWKGKGYAAGGPWLWEQYQSGKDPAAAEPAGLNRESRTAQGAEQPMTTSAVQEAEAVVHLR